MEEGHYWFQAKILNRANGNDVAGYAAYMSGGVVESRDDTLGKSRYNFVSTKSEVVAQWRVAPEGSPDWVYDQTELWNSVMGKEKRKDARLARTLVMSIPQEVPKEDYRELAESFAQEIVSEYGLICDVAIHDKGEGNPHVHMMTPLRRLTEGGDWGGRDEDLVSKKILYWLRATWQDKVNAVFSKRGIRMFVNARRRAKREYDKERRPKHE